MLIKLLIASIVITILNFCVIGIVDILSDIFTEYDGTISKRNIEERTGIMIFSLIPFLNCITFLVLCGMSIYFIFNTIYCKANETYDNNKSNTLLFKQAEKRRRKHHNK